MKLLETMNHKHMALGAVGLGVVKLLGVGKTLTLLLGGLAGFLFARHMQKSECGCEEGYEM